MRAAQAARAVPPPPLLLSPPPSAPPPSLPPSPPARHPVEPPAPVWRARRPRPRLPHEARAATSRRCLASQTTTSILASETPRASPPRWPLRPAPRGLRLAVRSARTGPWPDNTRFTIHPRTVIIFSSPGNASTHLSHETAATAASRGEQVSAECERDGPSALRERKTWRKMRSARRALPLAAARGSAPRSPRGKSSHHIRPGSAHRDDSSRTRCIQS